MTKISSLIPELLGRSLRYSSPEIIMLEGVPIEPRSLTPPGTVTCLVAGQGSPLLGQIRSAAHRKDHDELRRHGTTIARELARISRRRDRRFESLSDIPVLTEFRYRGRILAQGMFTSETLPVATASVLYSGGPFHDDGFQAVDYFHSAIISDTEHVVVVSMPSLTELEQAILSRVPEEHSEMPGIFWPVSANVVDRAVNKVWDRLEADEEEEEEDEREREVEEEDERTVEGEALEKIDRPEAEEVGAQDESGDLGYLNAVYLTALQQQDFSTLDETASAQTLLEIRMQLRKRR